MPNRLKLTRSQLARFLPDAESIKQFEKLFTIVDEEVNVVAVEEAATLAGIANDNSIIALGLISSIAQELYANSASIDAATKEAIALIAELSKRIEPDIAVVDIKASGAAATSISALMSSKSNGVLSWLSTQ